MVYVIIDNHLNLTNPNLHYFVVVDNLYQQQQNNVNLDLSDLDDSQLHM